MNAVSSPVCSRAHGRATVDRKALLSALTFCVADNKSIMPLLSCVHLRADGRELLVESTDLYVQQRATVAMREASPFECVVNRKDLLSQIKGIDSGEITLAVDGTWVQIEHADGHARVEAPMSPEDYPPTAPMPDVAMRPMAAKALREALSHVMPCVSTDETRAHLNSALFEVTSATGQIRRMVSTDGHRLARCDIGLGDASDAGVTPYLVSLTALESIAALVKKAEGDVSFAVSKDGKNMRVSLGDRSVTTRLVDAQFPPYGQVIPAQGPTAVTVPVKAFGQALKSARASASERTGGVILRASPAGLSVDVADKAKVAVTGAAAMGPARDLGINAAYLLDFLATLGKDVATVTIAISGELDPIRCDVGGVTWICMPMRMR
jgi:DNA polymerase-3 subunit beta